MRRSLTALLIALFAVPVFATEPNPSARQRDLVNELLDIMNVNQTSATIIDTMFSHIEKQIIDSASAKGDDAESIEEAKELFGMFRQRASKIDFDGLMRESTVRLYSKYFTEAELSDLIAFYGTATGRKSLEVLPAIMRESMEVGASQVAPKIEQAMKEALEESERKRPWRRTMSDIRSVATAIEAYATDQEDMLYPRGDYASLKEALVPTYMRELPEKDMWDHGYAYVVSPDGSRYRLVSGGSDGNFEWDSRRVAAESKKEGDEWEEVETQYRERLEDDLIFENGSFLQLPIQAKPKS